MIIHGTDISKMYGGNLIFEKLKIELNEGEKVGLVGPNGCGKTTLLKLLSGMEDPDEGQIHRKKGLRIGYLAQIPQYDAHITGGAVLESAFDQLVTIKERMDLIEGELEKSTDIETVNYNHLLLEYGELQEQFTRDGGFEIDAKIATVANGLGMEELLDQAFIDMSGGEQTKVSLGRMLLEEPDLLLLDEPTNHLDIDAVEWLESFMKDYKGTFLIVSHDRYFLDEVVKKVVNLEDGECHIYHGNYSSYVKEKEERLLREFQSYQEQQKKIHKMKETIKRLKEWANQANPPNEGLHKRARNMERALERMEKLKRPVLERKKMNLTFDGTTRSGKDVVQLDEVSKWFDGSSDILFEDVNMQLRWREKAAIVGKNGTGKSTLLKIILGEELPSSGKVKLGTQLNVGYLSQKEASFSSTMTVLDAFRDQVSVAEGEARHLLAKFMFYGARVFRSVMTLSGGERMRLQLAILMHQKVNLLVLDEPTNHLDIESREVLEDALDHFDGTILAVSHDRYFLNKLFEKTYWLVDGQLFWLPGTYRWAKEKLEAMLSKGLEDVSGREEREKTAPYLVPCEKSRHSKSNVIRCRSEDSIEKDIMNVEDCLDQLVSEMDQYCDDWMELEKLTVEKTRMERKREELYRELEQS